MCLYNSYWESFGDEDEHTGKYLFFSPYRSVLLGIVEYELDAGGFNCAKVSVEAKDDYVLCLYWEDDDRKFELAQRYAGRDDVKYRWWKSDADTRAGKYSDRYKACNGISESEALIEGDYEIQATETFDDSMMPGVGYDGCPYGD